MKQKKKKRQRPQGKRTEYLYKCIDGNWTYYPVAYCKYHQGVLTAAMMHVHRCHERQCKRLDTTQKFE